MTATRSWFSAVGPARLGISFSLYLLALGALGFKWLSPLSDFYERAGWTDLLLVLAAVARLVELVRGRQRPRPRLIHLALALYVLAAVGSALAAPDVDTSAKNVLLITELAALAVLTSHYAHDPRRLRTIVLVIAAVSLSTAALALVGLLLHYAGTDTSLVGAYGEQFLPSPRYARVAAGLATPPLLASFCIFASAVAAREDVELPRRLRLGIQVALLAVVTLTLSRGLIGFLCAWAIRGAARRRRRRAILAAALAAATGILLLAALTVGRLQLDPTRPSTATYEVPDPGNRREAFMTSLDTLVENPVLGCGPGCLPGENRGEPFRAHFTPLNVAATVGLPALAALTLLVGLLWRHRRRPTEVATWSGLAGLGIDGLAQDVEHFRHVWILLGLADAERRDDQAYRNRPSPAPAK